MKAILTDVTKCIGCNECVRACKITNELPADKPREWQKWDGLSANNWTSVLHDGSNNVRKQCRHCLEPACASVCPVGALEKTDLGAVVYDSGKCLGCRYCMMACPFGIPRYDWSSAVPYIKKCILCYDKIKSGELNEPACTHACPTGATIFGERDELLNIARMRIQSSDIYSNKIWGEKEVGGCNVLYLAPKGLSLDFLIYYTQRYNKDIKLLGEPDLNEPLPQTTKWAMGAVPFAFLGMGGIMSSIWWIMNRRQKLGKDKIEVKDNVNAKNLTNTANNDENDGVRNEQN